MRVNIYAEEMTDRVEIVEKEVNGQVFIGLRMYMYLPVTVNPGSPAQVQHTGPFIHGENDDDSSAVTFWGKRDLRDVLQKAIDMLDVYYKWRKNEKIRNEKYSKYRKFTIGNPGPGDTRV